MVQATAFSRDMEKTNRCFIEDSYHMGLPTCKGKLSIDIQAYLNKNNMEIKFSLDRKPGTDISWNPNLHVPNNFKSG